MTTDYRAEFPVTERWAFFNHASVAPLCRRARDRLRAWSDDMTENGDLNEPAWWREIETVRDGAARLINAERDEIALLKNTSEGIGFVAEGFPWRQEDNVVIVEGEYPANVYPWLHLRNRGVGVKTVPCRGPRIAIEDINAAIDNRTRMLSISFVEFATGFRNDLAALGELCHDRGIDFCVDAIQGLGVFPVDVDAMRIDYLAADGHKWLVAPEGAAIFYVRSDKIEKIRPTSIGWKNVVGWADYSTIDFTLRKDAARFENGSFNTGGFVALGASLSLFEEVGVENIRGAVKEITDHLVDRLKSIGAKIFSAREDDCWSGIVSFGYSKLDPREVVRRLRERHVLLSARDGRLRVSPHFYNDREDVERLIDALSEVG